MGSFNRGDELAYHWRPQLSADLVLLADIEPPPMGSRKHLSCCGLDETRMIGVLTSIASRREMWPVEITQGDNDPYPYQLHDGAHRFHASVAAGFSHIPALLVMR